MATHKVKSKVRRLQAFNLLLLCLHDVGLSETNNLLNNMSQMTNRQEQDLRVKRNEVLPRKNIILSAHSPAATTESSLTI